MKETKFSNSFSWLEGFCLTSCWPSETKSDGILLFSVALVFVFCWCFSWLEIVWFELPGIVTLLSSMTFKVLCYLQSEKIWAAFLQNYYMFAKNYYLHWIAGRANILSKYIIYIFFNFGLGFYCSFPMLFPKAPASCCKKFLN